MFELFEHTADVGLRIRAADLNGLFAEAARGLFSLIVENMDDVRPGRQCTYRLEADDPNRRTEPRTDEEDEDEFDFCWWQDEQEAPR